GALDPASRGRQFHLHGLRDPGRHPGRHQPAVHASYAGNLARSRDVRSDALHRRGTAGAPPLRLRAVRRRRAYVPRAALRLHAGKMLHVAFAAKPQRRAGAWLQAGVADVADPEAARRLAGDAEAGVTQTVIPGWAEGPDAEPRGTEVGDCTPTSPLLHRAGTAGKP